VGSLTPKPVRRPTSTNSEGSEHVPSRLVIYSSLSKRKEEFKPVQPDTVSMYTCGLTVNYLMHLGHARCYIFWDLVHRYLQYLGFKVEHVSNVTDISVDDNILKRLRETGESFQQLVTRYTQDYIEDRRRLGIADPYVYSIATQHIHEMIELVQHLLDQGHAYVADDGVYFRISTYPGYGQLSGIDRRRLRTGASGRITKDEYDKETVGDFALWKRASPDEPYWHSPWGPGRPGWHIECSAMSMKYLGETIDISGGGEDNIFPHHENSIAQSEAATGKPYVRFWMHVRHLMYNGERMSKSTGNFITARDAALKYGAALVRLSLLSAHYRKRMDFTESLTTATEGRIRQLQHAVAVLRFFKEKETPAQPKDDVLNRAIEEAEVHFRKAMNDDFNTVLAITQLFQFIERLHHHIDKYNRLGSQVAAKVLSVLERVFTVLFGDLYERELTPVPAPHTRQLVEYVLAEREKLRQDKAFNEADALRKMLTESGIEVIDTPNGPIWWTTVQTTLNVS
jgi:cysteinyl-tRNA synthetase